MFFIKAGAIIAWALVALGILQLVTGFSVAILFEESSAMIAASKRYLGVENSGEAINRGFMFLVSGILFGLLVQIAKK